MIEDIVTVSRSDLLKLLELAEESLFTSYDEFSGRPSRSNIRLIERINEVSGRNADLSACWFRRCEVVED